MLNTPDATLVAVARIVAVALILQTLELWSIRRVAADDGIWPWAIVRRDFTVFPIWVQRLVDAVLSYRGWLVLLGVRLLCALTLLWAPSALPCLILFATTLLIAMRWRGSFNGGSDFMTLVVLSALSVATVFSTHRMATVGALWYVALHACNSYFLAGLVKLRTPNWRSGRALVGFLQTTVYGRAPVPSAWLEQPLASRVAAWSVIGLECLFPLALINSTGCAALVGMAFMFHVGNAYVFGLNRFLLAWAATYPALWWCSQQAL